MGFCLVISPLKISDESPKIPSKSQESGWGFVGTMLYVKLCWDFIVFVKYFIWCIVMMFTYSYTHLHTVSGINIMTLFSFLFQLLCFQENEFSCSLYYAAWHYIFILIKQTVLKLLLIMFELSFICFFWFWQSKHQKHQAFEAELAANSDRIQSVVNMGRSKWISLLNIHF